MVLPEIPGIAHEISKTFTVLLANVTPRVPMGSLIIISVNLVQHLYKYIYKQRASLSYHINISIKDLPRSIRRAGVLEVVFMGIFGPLNVKYVISFFVFLKRKV